MAKTKQSLTAEERETIVSWNDEDKKIFIYSSKQPMIRRLKQNPLFELIEEENDSKYVVNPVCIRGYLPKNAITIKKKIRRLSEEQKAVLAERLKKGKEKEKMLTGVSDENGIVFR